MPFYYFKFLILTTFSQYTGSINVNIHVLVLSYKYFNPFHLSRFLGGSKANEFKDVDKTYFAINSICKSSMSTAVFRHEMNLHEDVWPLPHLHIISDRTDRYTLLPYSVSLWFVSIFFSIKQIGANSCKNCFKPHNFIKTRSPIFL